jgi:hypothetical protein
LTRVADQGCEEELLEVARLLTAAQLERALAAYRRVTSAEARDAHEREFASWFWDEDGSLVLRARLAGEEGALLLRALEAARESLTERRRAEGAAADGGCAEAQTKTEADDNEEGEPEAEAKAEADVPASDCAEPPTPPRRPSNIEALVAVAERALAPAPGERPGGERRQVVVHVDAAVLGDDAAGRCELEDGPALARETARRLTCDAALIAMREAQGEMLSVGRRTRSVPPAMRRALAARDGGCRFPGCQNRRYLDAHHVRHWARGGETRLDNLVLLCRPCHRLVHEGGYTLERERGGELRFHAPAGFPIPAVPRPPPADPDGLLERNRRSGLAIDAKTCLGGTGERMELVSAVDWLLHILE